MISILDQWDLKAKKQNFARDAFSTIADMKAFSENYLPQIFDAYCYEDGKKYRYNASNDVDETTGKWRVIGNGDIEKSDIVAKTIYIDYANGSDSNDGLSSDNPLKTIDKALELYQYASALTFNIMSDYTGDIKALGTVYCNCKSFSLQSVNSADIKTITGNIELGWIEYVSIRNINFVSSLKSNVYRALNLRYIPKVLLYNIEIDLTNTYSNVDTSYIQFQNCGFATVQNKIVLSKNVSSTKTIVDAILVNGGNCNITLDSTSSITGATNGIRVRNGSCASISSEVLDYITVTNKTVIGDEMSSLFIGGNLQNQNFVSKTETEIVFSGTMEEYEAVASSIPVGSAVLIKGNNGLTSLRNIAIQSIDIEYARANDTSYYIARIPKYAVNGMRITPKVRLTSADGQVGTSIADYTSTLTYAKTHGSIFTMNAGLFKINGDYAPHGRTIIDGVAVTDEDAGQTVSDVSAHEVYPLCIDANGNLSTPYDRDIPDATMIAGGVMQAVTGWGTVVQNYAETDSSVFDEQKHTGDYIRQGIGQYQNGDYFVLTTDGVKTTEVNETGMTYEEIATICISKGVKFFYSLDGGGSTETVIGDRQINLIYENTSGRVVPTVIEFVLEEN